MSYGAIDIANFFIQLSNSISDDSVDNMKINKMLYYAQGFSLAKLGRALFDEDIQAWDYGPVIPEVYRAFKCCGSKAIGEPTSEFDESKLKSDELNLLIDVFSAYGRYTGWALKEMTHVKGGPWDRVYEPGKNRVIDTESMRAYFENIQLETFDISKLNIPTVRAVPMAWDSDGDVVYG